MMKKNLILVFTGIIMLLSALDTKAQTSASQPNQAKAQAIKPGMIKVAILYTAGEGKKLDMDYYTKKHIPMVKSLMGDALKKVTIDKGIAGGAPGSPATYMVICDLYFDSIAAYQNAMAANGSKILADIPNYTNVQPVVQVSEVIE